MHTGIDIGLSCTAIISVDDKGEVLHKTCFGKQISVEYRKALKYHPIDRYKLYCDAFEKHFKDNSITGTIVMEEPRGSFQGHSIKLAEIKGAYIRCLDNLGFNSAHLYLPEAGTIKYFITGKGNADKDDIIEELNRRGYYVENDHEGDALAMALMSATNDLKYKYN